MIYNTSPINPYAFLTFLTDQKDRFATERDKIINDINMYEYAGNILEVYYLKEKLREIESCR